MPARPGATRNCAGWPVPGPGGLPFNLSRGASGPPEGVRALGERPPAGAGLPAQVYADAAPLPPFLPRLAALGEGLVIDHLGMTEAGLPVVLDLVAAGAM